MLSRRDSQYFFWDGKGACHRLGSSSGVDQGGPLAPLLFAFGFKPHLEQLEEDLRRLVADRGLDPNRVHLLAYLDDVTILVPPEIASEALAAAATAFRGFGLQLRADKTQICLSAAVAVGSAANLDWLLLRGSRLGRSVSEKL